ncbi:MAG: class I SAM-dependent methyltransferase [Pseudolabrys sp.]
MAYQSFEGEAGDSNSAEKLARIDMPADLTGKGVLDLGCNEGFFCIEAKKRGAAHVVGVDANEKWIELARKRAAEANAEIEFINGDFLEVKNRSFDLILMLSALHYASRPKAVLRRVHQLLSPNGLFILECGITDQAGRRMRRVLRGIDERMFPSVELLRDDWLDQFSVRHIRQSVMQEGDPNPRAVYHCRRLKPVVIFVSGPANAGKSSVARQFKDALVIEADTLTRPTRSKGAKASPEQKAVDEAMREHKSHLGLAWDALRTRPDIIRYFARLIGRMIQQNSGAKLIVIEGVMVADLAQAISADLKDKYVIWNLVPGAPASASAASPTLLESLRARILP